VKNTLNHNRYHIFKDTPYKDLDLDELVAENNTRKLDVDLESVLEYNIQCKIVF